MSARLVFLVSLWLCSALGHPITVSPRQSSRPTDDVLAGEEFLSLFYSDSPRPSPPRAASRVANNEPRSQPTDSRFFGEKLSFRKRLFNRKFGDTETGNRKFAPRNRYEPISPTLNSLPTTQAFSPSSFRPTEESTIEPLTNQDNAKNTIKYDEKTTSVSVSTSVTRNQDPPARTPDVQDVPSPTALQRSSLNIDESEEFVVGARQDILRVTNSPRLTSTRTFASQPAKGLVPKAPESVHTPEEGARNLDLRKPEPRQSEAETKTFQFAVSSETRGANFKISRAESKPEKVQYDEAYEAYDTQDPAGYYDEKVEGEKTAKSLLRPKSEPSAKNLPIVYSEPAKVYGEPAKVYSEPAKVYSEPAKVYSEPAKVYGEPAKVYSEPAKVYSEPAKVYGEPSKVYSEPAKVYSEPEKVFREQENVFKEQEKVFKEQEKGYSETLQRSQSLEEEKKESSQAGHVLETSNYKKYRVEEKTPDGFIVGEYGVLGHDGGSLRGVRYTADSDTNPSLIYDALVKFLKLK
nr:PREDICTED: uncharacterized protein LOC109030676 [Bemisia tabaci]